MLFEVRKMISSSTSSRGCWESLPSSLGRLLPLMAKLCHWLLLSSFGASAAWHFDSCAPGCERRAASERAGPDFAGVPIGAGRRTAEVPIAEKDDHSDSTSVKAELSASESRVTRDGPGNVTAQTLRHHRAEQPEQPDRREKAPGRPRHCSPTDRSGDGTDP